jgi:molybdopterin/thiamine biosynthesis adenylyltransferase
VLRWAVIVEFDVSLTKEQYERYRSQLNLPGMSEDAQDRLLKGIVAVVGLNPCGMHAAKFLAEVGLGRLVLVSTDNEQTPEFAASFQQLKNCSPDIVVTQQHWSFNSADAEALFTQVDVVVDGLENWQHKLAASDLCMQLRKPLIHAGGSGFRFQVYTMLPNRSACLRCVFPEIGIDDVPLTPTEAGALSPVSAMIGSLQALEALKLVAKVGASQGNELWKFDWLSGEFETIRGLDPRFDCPDCGRNAGRNG